MNILSSKGKCSACGKPRQWTLLINSPLTMETFTSWFNDNEGLCVECYMKRRQSNIVEKI